MLPPKLAQIIINLTCPPTGSTVLDPFCGTGVVLQEALLMNFGVYGTDIDKRMIEYSEENLRWLEAKFPNRMSRHNPKSIIYNLEIGDATNHHWFNSSALRSLPSALVVAGETYLGKPLSKEPSPDLLHTIMEECERIHRGALDNLHRQLPKGTRLCLAVPAWRVKNGFKHLRTLDYLRELGYNRIEFKFAKQQELIYFREDQLVARELVVLERI
jgi:tRNA G10  N-methylase Trm11